MKVFKTILSLALVLALACSMPAVSVSAADTSGLKEGIGFVTASALRLRSKPSTSSATLTSAAKDEIVVILGRSGEWYHVLYGLTEGYMHSSYLDVRAVENAELGYGEVNYAAVNMRSGPGTSYSRIAQSKQGQLAYIIGINNGWYKVIWQDQVCYIRSDYLTLTEAPYENRSSAKSPLFFRGGRSTGTKVSAQVLKESKNYISSDAYATTKAKQIIETAKRYIGVPYLWGGETPSGFDCSGFVQYVFRQNGILLNRTVVTQYQHGYAVSKSNLAPGDLIFFQNTYTTGLSHIGIYIGNNQFIHASSSQGITISSLSNSYWSAHYHSCRRVL